MVIIVVSVPVSATSIQDLLLIAATGISFRALTDPGDTGKLARFG